MTQKITTFSGAVYHYDPETGKITGGSRDLKDGYLIGNPALKFSMLISTPERAKQNPTAKKPGVRTSYVIAIEEETNE